MNDPRFEPCTLTELEEARRKLMADPALREQINREAVERGENFYVDEFGIGHCWQPLYVSGSGTL